MGRGEYALGSQRVNHIRGKKNTASRFHAHTRTGGITARSAQEGKTEEEICFHPHLKSQGRGQDNIKPPTFQWSAGQHVKMKK